MEDTSILSASMDCAPAPASHSETTSSSDRTSVEATAETDPAGEGLSTTPRRNGRGRRLRSRMTVPMDNSNGDVPDGSAAAGEAPPAPDTANGESAELPVVADASGSVSGPSLEQRIEAVLFASDAPVSPSRLAEAVDAAPGDVRLAVAELNCKYGCVGLSFRIEEIARGYQMLTLPSYRPWVERLNNKQAETRLTGAALEALAIVAYKQPVIRAEIESIRGVACGDVLTRLRDSGLVRIVGRAEVVGRPLMYGTTRKFLDVFGLADLKDLPSMEEFGVRTAAAISRGAADADDAKPAGPVLDTPAADPAGAPAEAPIADTEAA